MKVRNSFTATMIINPRWAYLYIVICACGCKSPFWSHFAKINTQNWFFSMPGDFWSIEFHRGLNTWAQKHRKSSNVKQTKLWKRTSDQHSQLVSCAQIWLSLSRHKSQIHIWVLPWIHMCSVCPNLEVVGGDDQNMCFDDLRPYNRNGRSKDTFS